MSDRAIHGEIHDRLKHDGRTLPRSVEGERDSTWIVADYLDVVLHVFTPETRAYYRLEQLWGDVPVPAERPCRAGFGRRLSG